MKNILAISLIILVMGMTGRAQEQPIKSLTLADVIDQTLKNNLDLQIEMSNPEIARALWRKSTSILIPLADVWFFQCQKVNPQFLQRSPASISKSLNSGLPSFSLLQNTPPSAAI